MEMEMRAHQILLASRTYYRDEHTCETCDTGKRDLARGQQKLIAREIDYSTPNFNISLRWPKFSRWPNDFSKGPDIQKEFACGQQ